MAGSEAPGAGRPGETGTGKELVARRIHAERARRRARSSPSTAPPSPRRCSRRSSSATSEAPSPGRREKREGRFKAADRGTLLLDEIAEMPLPAQAKLLRVVQEGRFEPLGTNAGGPRRRADRVRHAPRSEAAHRRGPLPGGPLLPAQRASPLHIPPLRERPGDMPLLVDHFLRDSRARRTDALPELSLPRWQALTAYPFPATCASSRTPSSTRSCSRAAAPSSSSTCPTTSRGWPERPS